jgi:HK97 family phage portal protein
MELRPWRWFSKSRSPEQLVTKSAGPYSLNQLGELFGSVVNESSVMKLEAFYSCVRDKSDTIGQLPLRLYQVDREGRRTQIQTGRTRRLFTQKPCDYMSMQDFNTMVVASIEIRGAFYAYKEFNDRGNVMSITPFRNQNNVHPAMDANGNVYYTYTTNDCKIKDPYRIEDLFIIKGITLDGYTPISPVYAQATLLGIAKTQDDSYQALQAGGITAQMALSTDTVFNDPDARQRLKDDFAKFRGPEGRKEIPIFEQGLKPISLQLTPQEAELLGQKDFTVKRISSMTGVPLHRINMYEGTMSKGVLPELDEAYMRNKLNPILVKIEVAFNELLPDGQKVEFNRKAFYQGSPWRLVEAVSLEMKSGAATVNEGREDLGREPVEGGDVFVIDSNNATYGTWEELPAVREQINGREANANANPPEGDENANG